MNNTSGDNGDNIFIACIFISSSKYDISDTVYNNVSNSWFYIIGVKNVTTSSNLLFKMVDQFDIISNFI